MKRVEPALLLQCQARSRVSYPMARERRGWLNMTLKLQHRCFLFLSLVTQVMDIIMTPAGPEIRTQTYHWQQLGPCHYHGPSGSTVHPNQYGPRSSKALANSMVSGSSPDPWHPLSPQCQQEQGHQPRSWLLLGHRKSHLT